MKKSDIIYLMIIIVLAGTIGYLVFVRPSSNQIDAGKWQDKIMDKIAKDSISFSKKSDSLAAEVDRYRREIELIKRQRAINIEEYEKLLNSYISNKRLDSIRSSNRRRGQQRYVTKRGDTLRSVLR